MKVRIDRLKLAIDKLWYDHVGYGSALNDNSTTEVDIELVEADLKNSMVTVLQIVAKKNDGISEQTRCVAIFEECDNKDPVMTTTEVKDLRPEKRK